ncbi:MAG TPA: hypothetical protein VNW54_02440 [Granulicella sp.]|jgi:hypothetical protein|nr:hypothetical protein [Granulicella sp.]
MSIAPISGAATTQAPVQLQKPVAAPQPASTPAATPAATVPISPAGQKAASTGEVDRDGDGR